MVVALMNRLSQPHLQTKLHNLAINSHRSLLNMFKKGSAKHVSEPPVREEKPLLPAQSHGQLEFGQSSNYLLPLEKRAIRIKPKHTMLYRVDRLPHPPLCYKKRFPNNHDPCFV